MCRTALTARLLHLCDAQHRAVATYDTHAVLVHADDGSGNVFFAEGFVGLCRPNFERLFHVGTHAAGRRIKRAYFARDNLRRLCPIDFCFRLVDFFGVAYAVGWLWCGLRCSAVAQLTQIVHDHARAHFGQFIVQCGGGVLFGHGQAFDCEHIAGVQPRVHLHQRDAGVGVACLNRSVNRCGAAPAG